LGVDDARTARNRRVEIVTELMALRDPQARFQWAVERARKRPSLPDSQRLDTCRVSGCQVRLWWVAEQEGERWRFASDSDAATLKAMTGLLAECYDGETSEGILADPPTWMEASGLLRQLAESRRATVLRVVEMMMTGARRG